MKTGVRIGFVLACVAGLLFSWNVTKAEAISFPDTYLHPLDRNSGQQGLDRIGTATPFEIYGHDWLTSADTTLRIWTSWDLGLDGKALFDVQVGDVFIYASTETIAVALRDHNSFLGEGDFKAGDIFEPTVLLKSDHYFGDGPGLPGTGVLNDLYYSKYGDNEIVLASEGDLKPEAADAIGYYYDPVEGKYAITITFPYNFDMHPGIRFAWTCANDIIHHVPEPTTMLLLGTGLIFLAGFRRKFRA